VEGVQHTDTHAKLSQWLDLKQQYLLARPPINSVSDANTQITLLDRYVAEAAAYRASAVAGFESLGAKTLAEKYQTDLSSYVFDHTAYSQPPYDKDCPEAKANLQKRQQDVTDRLAHLAELEGKLRAELQQALKLELQKEKLRLEYAHEALEYTKWTGATCSSLAIETFGFNLEEVQAYKKVIEESGKDRRAKAAEKLGEIKKLVAEMEAIKVGANIYSKLSVADLEKAQAEVDATVTARGGRYAKELQRQIENDQLCQDFAKLVDPFAKVIVEKKDAVSASKEDLEIQLKAVLELLAGTKAQEEDREKIRAVAKKMEERAITNNKHTTLTLKDVEVTLAQFVKFLEAKKTMLEAEIEHAKLRGVTPEQLKEIEEQFKKFDKDNSGDIDRKEVTACLYSLGEERTSTEIKAIVDQYGDKQSQKMTLAQFREFMVHLYGDSDTKEEIVTGFQLINRAKPHAEPKHLQDVLSEADVKYFVESAPKKDPGFDYVAWCESMFAR
jgi:hypothetical protein